MGDEGAATAVGFSRGTSVDLVDRPTRIGPYRILDVLGKGGMGVVYLAEQLEPVHRQVAVKVLRTADDSDLVVARFNAERQALAVLDHPNITKVFDAGITEHGWPYFAMERVVGVPLGDYVGAHVLTIAERLRLFLQVCRAIQHAHQKGLIHRDVKPSNILITTIDDAPVCKVIDFGIAKATQGDTGARLTQTGTNVGTPAYMSPEQASRSSLDVDTRSDIYSLGVVLYELLAGILPFETSLPAMSILAYHVSGDTTAPSARVASLAPAEQERLAAQCGTDAPSFVRALTGDLDWITLKALEKERDRRYQTATELAADIERYLSNRPVSASPPSRVYLARKFVRRHRIGVAFAATTTLLVVGGAVAIAAQARRVSQARAVAVQRQTQAEELINFMLGDLHTRLSAIGGLDVLEQVGTAAREYFEAVPEGDLTDQELFRRSQALRQIGQVRVDKGDFTGAMPLFRQSLSLVGPLARRDSSNSEWQLGLGASHFWVGFIHFRQNDLDSALAHFTPYLAITKALVARAPDSVRFHNELGQASSNIGSVKEFKGDLPGALSAFRDAIRAQENVVRRDSMTLDWQMDLANSYNSIGVVQRKLGDFAGALASHRAELALKQRLVARDPPNQVYKHRLAAALAFLAELDLTLGNAEDATREGNASLDLYTALAAADTSNPDKRRFLGTAHRIDATIALERGNTAEALRALGESRALLDPQISPTPNNAAWQTALARTLTLSSFALTAAGRPQDAEAEARRAVSIVEPVVAKRPTDQFARLALADAYIAAGDAARRRGDTTAARGAYTGALAAVDSVARATGVAELRVLQSTALVALGRLDDARPIVRALDRQGYRRPRWLARMRAAGLLVPQ
ncbi:MAG TPA: protein kinase [Gemmatimonadaceae bacterium]|nr:protein kinase [Gemmatimonadaceae bacterium]